MRFMGRIFSGVAYYVSLGVFLVGSFLLNLLCLVLGILPGSRSLKGPLRSTLLFLFRQWAWAMRLIRVLDLRTPNQTRRKSQDGEIWVMNHPTILDVSFMLKFIANGTCVYKRSIGSNPLYGAVASLAGYIPNVGGVDVVRLSCEALARGEDLIIFPEGTRSTRMKLDKFKPGFALIAKRSRATINVMWMDSPADFMTREVAFSAIPNLPASVTIERIARIEVSRCSTVSSILEEIQQIYRQRIGEEVQS